MRSRLLLDLDQHLVTMFVDYK